MKKVKLILTFIFGAFMIFGGVNHFLKPEMYFPFIPEILPQEAIVYASGFAEVAVGIGACLPKFRAKATLGILLLMLAFLPLHVVDVFKTNPAIGTHEAAVIRLPIQFVLILWAWFINRKPVV